MTDAPNPAMIREIQTRIAQGWTAKVSGTTVRCDGPAGATLSINCRDAAGATALLKAATG